jgi:hypothetical protein
MFMKQATSDRLLGMLVTLATGAAILYIQVSDDCQGCAHIRSEKVCMHMPLCMHGLMHLYHSNPVQHRIKVFVNRRKASGKGERSETKKVRPARTVPSRCTRQGTGTITSLVCSCVD